MVLYPYSGPLASYLSTCNSAPTRRQLNETLHHQGPPCQPLAPDSRLLISSPAAMASSMSLSSVNAILILSTDDSTRILAKYFTPPHQSTTSGAGNDSANAGPYPTVKEQKAFEKALLDKTAKQTSDIILYDNRVVVFKMESDVMIYVVGSADENEILLYNVILCLRDTLSILLKYGLSSLT